MHQITRLTAAAALLASTVAHATVYTVATPSGGSLSVDATQVRASSYGGGSAVNVASSNGSITADVQSTLGSTALQASAQLYASYNMSGISNGASPSAAAGMGVSVPLTFSNAAAAQTGLLLDISGSSRGAAITSGNAYHHYNLVVTVSDYDSATNTSTALFTTTLQFADNNLVTPYDVQALLPGGTTLHSLYVSTFLNVDGLTSLTANSTPQQFYSAQSVLTHLSLTPTAVPEPGMAWLFALGMAGMAVQRRGRQSRG